MKKTLSPRGPDRCLEAWLAALGPMSGSSSREHPSGIHPIEGRMDVLRSAAAAVKAARRRGERVPFADALDGLGLGLLDRLLLLALLRETLDARQRAGLRLLQLCDAAGAASWQQQDEVRRRLEEAGALRRLGLVQSDGDRCLPERLYRLAPGWKEALLDGRTAPAAVPDDVPATAAERTALLLLLGRVLVEAAAPDPRERLVFWGDPLPDRPGWSPLRYLRRSLAQDVAPLFSEDLAFAADPLVAPLREAGATSPAEIALFLALLPREPQEPPLAWSLLWPVLEGLPGATQGFPALAGPSAPLVRAGLVSSSGSPPVLHATPSARARVLLPGIPCPGDGPPLVPFAPEAAELFERIDPDVTLDDVVLPPSVRSRLLEALAVPAGLRAMHDAWGLGEGLLGATGVALLLHGPPGTGKTLTARAVAGTLGRSLVRLRTDQLLSKWVGESEKRIAAVFAAAREAGDVVLLDEADSLLARRTDDARRWEVSMTNILLQEVERFPGVLVLTTNRDAALDPALERRLLARLELGPPDAEGRERLWRRHLPPKVPLAADVDLRDLARRHRLTGSGIRTAALLAVARAARRPEGEQVVARRDLEEAAAAESTRQRRERPVAGFSPPAADRPRLSLVAGPARPEGKETS